MISIFIYFLSLAEYVLRNATVQKLTYFVMHLSNNITFTMCTHLNSQYTH